MGNKNEIPWEFIYSLHELLNVHLIKQSVRSYHRCLNTIFGEVGSFVSEEVVLQLVSSKCLPILPYGTELSGLKVVKG
jgi:hypothetical protein